MVYLLQLPCDILDLIITMLAISTNGAAEIANISAVCKLFRLLARRAHVLRQVNFSSLTYTKDFTMHHHRKGLLCVCTQVGNQAAKSIFAKALLYNDRWFMQMIADMNKEALESRVSYSGLLDYHSIVRSYIRHSSCTDMRMMCDHLLEYVTSFAGFKVACNIGMIEAINMMYYATSLRLHEHRIWSTEFTGNPTFYPRLLDYQLRGHRKRLLAAFDELFPSKPV